MAKDYSLPYQDLTNLVPQYLRNPMVKSLMDNLFNRFLTQDEAVPLYGYVGRAPTSPDDRTPKVPQATPERDINALIPVLSFKVGSETYTFTAQDLIRKAEVLGISEDQSQWLYSQGNNYAPPIDFDKFTNFFNYYWIANALPSTPDLPWNPTKAPEYYVAKTPAPTDLDKLNARAATTANTVTTGTGFYQQTWTVLFSSPTTFTVQANGPLIGFLPGEDLQGPFTLPTLANVAAPGPYPTDVFPVSFNVLSAPGPLLTFNIVRDVILDNSAGPYAYEGFAPGDSFTISAPFITSTYSVTFAGGPGQKGKISGVNALDTYQTIDGVLLKENDRVLVQHGSAAVQAIYIVKPGTWVLAPDFDLTTAAPGARVFVTDGGQANSLFTSFAAPGGYGWTLTAAPTVSNTSDWQEGNFWAKRDDLTSLGVDPAKVVQAVRPIIEYSADIQLNTHVGGDGLPVDVGGTVYEQRKTEFNQAPLYDLFRYDGTSARQVSSIFFYVEGATEAIDVALQRRVKHSENASADFLFNHGLLTGENSLLFYKDKAGALHTIWHPGYSNATIVDQEYGGTGNGTLVATPGTDAFSAQQIWTLTAVSPTSFEVSGSKTKVLPAPYDVITVGTPYANGLFNATITAGLTPFVAGDTFKFRLGNFETTRYVYRDSDQQLYDLYGGPALDVNGVGAWQVPRMFFNNVASDNGDEVPEGTLYSHFRGMLANQLQTTAADDAFGGSIKLWSEQQNLLAALLMQRDLTPISVIDLAQRQYEVGLNQITDLYFTQILEYFSKVEVLSRPADVNELLDFLLAIRSKDEDVRTVLYDSTSPVIGFPATLPQLGVTPLVQPLVVFDNELGVELLQHHDGHRSALYVQTPEFRDRLFSSKLTIKRSDGNVTPAIGSYTTLPPALPYKGEIWLYPGVDTEIRAFDVVSDRFIAPGPAGLEIGDYWFNRGANSLSIWDGALWQAEPNLQAPWITIDMAELLNDVVLKTEERLHDGISSEQRTYFTEAEVQDAVYSALAQDLQRELATWSAVNGVDPTAPDYVSTDAFTWNYGSSPPGSFAPVTSATVPARWYKALQSHQNTVPGVLPTSRPNVEPWKLLGNTVKPGGWDALYRAVVTPSDVEAGSYITGPTATTVSYSAVPLNTVLNGLPTIDGVIMTAGQTVLLVSEASSANNGAWVVSSGGWARAAVPLAQNTIWAIQGGVEYSGTQWVLMANVVTPNVDPAPFEQIRLWLPSMWDAIQLARPTLKLSVDVKRDALLPPYVSITVPWSVHALTNQLPPTPADAYVFGEGSPAETIWVKDTAYRYAMARALFRLDPLSFLGNCWGFEWVQVDGILYDGYDMSVPGHPRFRLHGQDSNTVTRLVPFTTTLITGPAAYTLTITHDAYTSLRQQSWTVRDQTGLLIGHLNEGVTSTLTGGGYTLANVRIEDEGLPFRVGDKFTITGNANGSGMSVLFEPSSWYRIHGFGQTFTHALRASSVDTNQGYAMEAYRGWDVNLGYRAGGLVSTDDLRLFTDLEALPESAYTLRFKRSPFANDLWLQALRVTVVQIGSSTTNSLGFTVPANDGSDWVFRIEGYNTRYLTLEYYPLNTAGSYSTFFALSKEHTSREWRHYTDITGPAVSSQLPITITGLQNLVDLLFGYAKKLEDDGWSFDDPDAQNIDAETGRVRNWQLEIEKVVDRVYAGLELGQGHVMNPFIDRVWLDQPTGLLCEFFDTSLFDVTAHPAVFDTLGVKIETNDLRVLRSRGRSQIGAIVPMFVVHAQVDEYEHLFVLNNLSSPSTGEGLIYDPFSGARISTLKLNGRRQGSNSLRPEFGGHYLVGDEVKRNFQASADKIANYYNPDTVFEDELSTKHALALLGFTKKSYMSDLDLNDRSQFNFWRGLIQMKGTNASIDAFLNNDRFEDAKLDEYWAYKVAEYGDSRSKIFPEMKLTVNDTLQQFTRLIFDPTSIPTGFEAFTVILSGDEARWFSIDDLDGETSFESQVIGTYTKTVALNEIVMLPFIADQLVISVGTATQINGNTLQATTAGTLTLTGYGPSTPKFNPLKLLNYVDVELVEEIPHWHPAIGQHTPVALESVNVISTRDPAKYNVSTLVTGNSNFDPLRIWGANEVGRVWWDTTNLSYLPYSDATIFTTVDERLSRWGTLTDYATVDVAEWVESSVAPANYDVQAAIDAGNADLDPRTRAEGTVYGAKTYSRERIWSVYPIGWSYAGVALEAAHPSFGTSSFNSNLSFQTVGTLTYAVLESTTFALSNITAGMHLGAWQQDAAATRPLSEFTILDGFTKILTGTPIAPITSGTLTATAALTVTSHTPAIGQLNFVYGATELIATQLRDADGLLTTEWDIATYVQIINDGNIETIQIRNDRGISATATGAPIERTQAIASASFTTLVGQTFTFNVPAYGLLITIVAQNAATHNTETMAQFIENAFLANVSMFDAVTVQPVCPLEPIVILEQTGLNIGSPYAFSNDTIDPLYTLNDGVGWRAWSVPTQAQLDADSRVPNSSWFPYVGIPYAYSTVPVPIGVVQDGAAGASYTLNNGTVIQRYSTIWGDWTELKQLKLEQVAITAGNVLFTVPTGTTADRVSVYVNGVAQLTGTYTLVGVDLTVLNVPLGHQVVAIVRAYSPSAVELAFDPAVKDDLLVQRQYKTDYQYVQVPVRDSNGNITTTKYYFWVKNRTTAAPKNNLSVKAVAQLLVEGPSQYLTFQNINDDLVPGQYEYNAVAIAGLNYVVTQDNTFKLRFTRNFTLRDDPEQLNLKDTHAEWTLIRPGQRVKVPEMLWNLMTNAACGGDPAGNPLPSPERTSYDERNGTRTRFGFGADQILAPTDLVTSTLEYTILNTKLINDAGPVPIPDYMTFLDFSQSDQWFSTPTNARNTLTTIWNQGKVSQINELFFAVLEDIAASNYEMTDIFKTSRLSAYSIKVVRSGAAAPTYE